MSTTVRDDHSRGTSNFTRRLSFVDCSTVARRWGPFWATEATEIGRLTSKFWAAVLKGTWWQTIKLGGSIVGHTVIHCALTKGNRSARSWNCMELFLATLRLMTRKTLISISGKNLEVWLATFLRLFVVKETWPLQFKTHNLLSVSLQSLIQNLIWGVGFWLCPKCGFQISRRLGTNLSANEFLLYWWTECQASYTGWSLWLHSLQVLIGLKTSGMVCSCSSPHVEHYLIDPWPTGWWFIPTGRRETERFPQDSL